jgi:hypothetical protein
MESYPYRFPIEHFFRMTAEELAKYPPRKPGGESLFTGLQGAVRSRARINALYEHPALRLIQRDAMRVTGVEVKGPAGSGRFEPRKLVVLTCCGYEYDEALKISCLLPTPCTSTVRR